MRLRPDLLAGGCLALLALPSAWCADAMSASHAEGRPMLVQRSLDETVLISRRMAAQETGDPPSSFVVVRAESVRWPDSSLGCPQADRVYTQAVVPGYRVQLRAPDGRLLNFHASQRGAVVHCPDDRALPPLPGPPS